MEPGNGRYAGRIKYYDRRGNKVYVPAINLGFGHIHYLRRRYFRTATACEEYGKRVAKRYQKPGLEGCSGTYPEKRLPNAPRMAWKTACKVYKARKMQSAATIRLADKLRQEYALLNSWSRASRACGVLTPAGKPNPRLAQMIVNGYEPKLEETRQRLGLPPICPSCNRRLPRPPRELPEWPKQAVQFLAEREEAVGALDHLRVYGRNGKRARLPVRETSRKSELERNALQIIES